MLALRRLLIIVAASVTPILVVEWLLPVPPFLQLQYQFSPDTGRRLAASTQSVVRGPGFKNLVTTNSLGFHDREHAEVSEGGRTRIALIGDSFVEAIQVSQQETVCAALERLGNIEAMCFGVSGSGVPSYVKMYELLVKPLQPELVFVLIYLENDFRDASISMGADPEKWRARLTAQESIVWVAPVSERDTRLSSWGRLKEALQRTSLGFLFRSSLHNSWLEAALISGGVFAEPRISGVTVKDGLPLDWGIYRTPLGPEFSESVRVTRSALLEMKALAEKSGSTLVFVTIPSQNRIRSSHHAALIKKLEMNWAANWNIDQPEMLMHAIAAELRVPILHLRPALAARADDAYLEAEGHWSPIGHEIAAQSIFTWLAEQRSNRATKP